MPTILPYKGIMPTIADDAYIADNAVIIGDVHIGSKSSVWFGAVVRGDVCHVRIGERTNIQDGTVIHVTRVKGPTIIGSGVTIGHSVLLHACTLEDDCFIGMGSTVMDDAVVQKGAMVAAAGLITPRKTVLDGQIWGGNPGKFLRDMKQSEKDFVEISAQNYVNLSREYMD
jgi:carbonic anhydrase/acetyltransferase-like protein (isoleucine patch superfamily)